MCMPLQSKEKKNYVALLSAIYHVRKAVNNFFFKDRAGNN